MVATTTSRSSSADQPPDSFARRLCASRLNRKLTQWQLAARSGVERGAIAQFEQGRRHPSFEALRALVIALGVRADFLLVTGGAVDRSKPTREIAR